MQCADLRVTASLCIVVLVCTSFLTIVKTPEVPVKSIQCCCDNPHATSKIDHPNDADIAGLALVKKIFQMLGVMPRAMVRVCAFQFLAWWSWSYQILFAAVWVGKVVNQGDAAAPVGSHLYVLYEQGVKAASAGFVAFAVLSGVVCLFLPSVLHRCGNRRTLAAAQVLLVLCYLSTFTIPARAIYLAAANIAAFALPWGVFLVVPWDLTAQLAPADQRGLYMGALNIFACLARLIVSLSGPLLVIIFGEGNATQAALGTGGEQVRRGWPHLVHPYPTPIWAVTCIRRLPCRSFSIPGLLVTPAKPSFLSAAAALVAFLSLGIVPGVVTKAEPPTAYISSDGLAVLVKVDIGEETKDEAVGAAVIRATDDPMRHFPTSMIV